MAINLAGIGHSEVSELGIHIKFWSLRPKIRNKCFSVVFFAKSVGIVWTPDISLVILLVFIFFLLIARPSSYDNCFVIIRVVSYRHLIRLYF